MSQGQIRGFVRPTGPLLEGVLSNPHHRKVHILSGTGDSQRDSLESIRANHSQLKPPIFTARHTDSHESLEFPIRANHPIRANRADRFARITPLSPHIFPPDNGFLLYLAVVLQSPGVEQTLRVWDFLVRSLRECWSVQREPCTHRLGEKQLFIIIYLGY